MRAVYARVWKTRRGIGGYKIMGGGVSKNKCGLAKLNSGNKKRYHKIYRGGGQSIKIDTGCAAHSVGS